jgi:hypothetical protein
MSVLKCQQMSIFPFLLCKSVNSALFILLQSVAFSSVEVSFLTVTFCHLTKTIVQMLALYAMPLAGNTGH